MTKLTVQYTMGKKREFVVIHPEENYALRVMAKDEAEVRRRLLDWARKEFDEPELSGEQLAQDGYEVWEVRELK